jgi:rhodanese-related sulfurtransferase
MQDITVQELKHKLDSGEKFVFIDVREAWENEEANLGAQLIPLGELMTRVYELEEHKNDEIVIHCRSGARSGMAKQLLVAQGFTNVRNVLGGIMDWHNNYGK